MIWLTWRQFRVQAAVVYGALAAIAVALVITGMQVADLTQGEAFFDAFVADSAKTAAFNLGYVALLALPAIVGVFWGAPLIARELEAGTHRLVWNQTVTRTRWLAVKLGLGGLAAMAAAGALSLVVTWWSGPIDDALAAGAENSQFYAFPRLSPQLFVARGIVPIGYAAFAFTVGVAAGAVIRRTVPAMAVTLAIYVAVQIAMPTLVREQLGSSQLTTTITANNLRGLLAEGPEGPVTELEVGIEYPGAWLIGNQTVDARGQAVSVLPKWVMGCVPAPVAGANPERGEPGCFSRLAEAGYRQRVTYMPASRFWTLQAIETAIFLGLALALAGGTFWWVRNRVT